MALQGLFLSLLAANLPATAEGGIWPESLSFPVDKPSYGVPLRPPVIDEGMLMPLDLVGFDLEHNGELVETRPSGSVSGPRPALREGEPLRVTCYWRKTGAQGKPYVNLTIQGQGPAFTGSGPVDSAAWRPGAIHTSQHEISLHRMRYNGPAVMTFSLSDAEHTESAALWREPVHVCPSTRLLDSDVESDALRAYFGRLTGRLGLMLRLGPQNEVTLPIQNLRGPAGGAGVVSATRYDNTLRQGAPICRLEFLDDSGKVLDTVLLRLGITTAKADIGEYPSGVISSQPIKVFSAKPAGQPSRYGLGDWDIRLYGATMSFDQPIRPTSVRLAFLAAEGLLEIRALAFLPARSAL